MINMDKIQEDSFDNWNILKKNIQAGKKVEYFRERQIWWCSVGQNVGFEVYGKGNSFSRPVLVFKKLTHDTFIGIPLTSKNKSVNAMLHQIRIFDKKRLVNRFGEVDDADFKRISDGFLALYRSKNIHPALRQESMGKSQK